MQGWQISRGLPQLESMRKRHIYIIQVVHRCSSKQFIYGYPPTMAISKHGKHGARKWYTGKICSAWPLMKVVILKLVAWPRHMDIDEQNKGRAAATSHAVSQPTSLKHRIIHSTVLNLFIVTGPFKIQHNFLLTEPLQKQRPKCAPTGKSPKAIDQFLSGQWNQLFSEWVATSHPRKIHMLGQSS